MRAHAGTDIQQYEALIIMGLMDERMLAAWRTALVPMTNARLSLDAVERAFGTLCRRFWSGRGGALCAQHHHLPIRPPRLPSTDLSLSAWRRCRR